MMDGEWRPAARNELDSLTAAQQAVVLREVRTVLEHGLGYEHVAYVDHPRLGNALWRLKVNDDTGTNHRVFRPAW